MGWVIQKRVKFNYFIKNQESEKCPWITGIKDFKNQQSEKCPWITGIKDFTNQESEKCPWITGIKDFKNQESEKCPWITGIKDFKNQESEKCPWITGIKDFKNQESEKMHQNEGHQKMWGKIFLMYLIKVQVATLKWFFNFNNINLIAPHFLMHSLVLVLGAWFLVLVLGSWFLVLGSWF